MTFVSHHARAFVALVLAATTAAAGCSGTTSTGDAEQREALFLPRKSLRIAVVGAGPSGLTAADTLVDLGYQHVTVFEKSDRIGGKVYSLHQGGQISEMGAVFASPDYTKVLSYADKYGIPYEAYNTNQAILDENGVRQSQESFLTSKYSTLQILGATAAYAGALALFAIVGKNGLAWLPGDVDMPFDQFADKYGFRPIAELIRSVMIGFGYGYYETAPAAYFWKLMPWLVKIGGPKGLAPVQYYTFPTGYQSVWEAVARRLDVRLRSEVTSIVRRPAGSPSRILLTVNGTQQLEFDAVIISAPLNKVGSFMQLTDEERALFSQVQSERYVVSLFTALNLVPSEVLFFHNNARPSRIDHVAVWANRSAENPIYVGYQIADWNTSNAQLQATLAADVASQGGTFGATLVKQEWDYFPHVTPEVMADGFFEKVEALQGKNNVFYVGSTLSFETVEHSARYAESTVRFNFLPAVLP